MRAGTASALPSLPFTNVRPTGPGLVTSPLLHPSLHSSIAIRSSAPRARSGTEKAVTRTRAARWSSSTRTNHSTMASFYLAGLPCSPICLVLPLPLPLLPLRRAPRRAGRLRAARVGVVMSIRATR
ncbi:hypothetical protein T439DRAFT_247930 [Meredithblackwellia eburnea MCA 4105]